jgi:GAF domain-containing protein
MIKALTGSAFALPFFYFLDYYIYSSMNQQEDIMADYELIRKQMLALVEDSRHYIPLMSNVSALLFSQMKDVNWAGFYLVMDRALILGPFQGKVACVRIEKGKGVCGTAWERDEVMLVPDVHEFPGHIACDSASRSEIVIPIHRNGEVCGVLDIDSPVKERFSGDDREGLTELAASMEKIMEW